MPMNSQAIGFAAFLLAVCSFIVAESRVGSKVSFAVDADEGKGSRRELATSCVDQFDYDINIYMVPHLVTSSFSCDETELEEIGHQLTIAHQGVLEVGDPRLANVIELLANLCEPAQVGRRLRFTSSGSGYGFNWSGSGRCKYGCPEENLDADHSGGRNLLEHPANTFPVDHGRKYLGSNETADTITELVLWNKGDKSNLSPRRTLRPMDVIDLASSGSSFTIEAQTLGDISKVVFDVDDTVGYSEDIQPPFLLERDLDTVFSVSLPIAEVGPHTITATPYSSLGTQLKPVTYMFMVVDSTTTSSRLSSTKSRRAQITYQTREELIRILEWDLTYFLTAEVHYHFFPQGGHCLGGKYVWMVVDLEEIEDGHCATDVNCGGLLAASCAECPQGNGESWCNGDCVWSDNQCLLGESTSTVNCGNHKASSCAECPQGHGMTWCGGECFWSYTLSQCIGG